MHVKELRISSVVLLVSLATNSFTPRQDHLAIKVDNFVVEPRARLESDQVPI